jgi:signal transduction histidine kinase/ActR/RegA family two-component response regulator
VTESDEARGASGFLSTEIGDARQRRVVLLIVSISLAAFLAGLPFLRMRLPEAPAFIPGFEGAISIIGVVTAALLFGQFMQLRSRSLLVLAAGYIFDAAMAVPHALTFPGSFSPAGLLQAGSQTAGWLYIFWHSGFPLFVLAYGLLARFGSDRVAGDPARAVVVACAGAIGLATAFTLLTTLGHDRLPAIIRDNAYTPGLLRGVGPAIWSSALVALAVLWSRRNPTVLDLWLMAVLVAWLLEIAYSGRLGMHRYDFGWYAGRIYGLLARSFLLVMLLFEIYRLYASLTEALKLANRRNVELLQSREAFARVQRMEAMGRVVAGVAHDFNNILAVITGSLEIARRELNPSARRRDLLQSALQAARRGAETTQQLMTFVRGQALRPEVLNANDAIKGLEELIKRAVGDGVRVTMSLSPDLWPVRIDRSQFEAALLNIMANARDAAEGAGEITIETKNVSLREEDVPGLTGGDFAMMSVSDNGPGIPPQIAALAFDPFFTTKDVGKGSGLGLSQVYGFARGAGGQARIAAGSGAGATIEVYLPKSLEAPIGAAEIHDFPEDGAANGELKVLLVEDDPDVRNSTADLLTTLGFDVVMTEGPHEALSILARDPSIGLLFSDVAMPGGMNGAELAVEARRAHPNLKVLLASGYPAPVLAKKFALPENVQVLCKPFVPDDLMKELRRLAPAPDPASRRDPI